MSENENEKEKKGQSESPVTVFVCGSDRCPADDRPHQWDGKELRTENISSSTCSKCGLAHIDWCMLNAP